MSESLITRVRSVLEEIDSVDPREIAREVAAATSEEELREFYATSLIGTVRSVIREHRNRAITNALSSARSAKLSQRRDWWAEMCAARIHVGASKWMQLGDCTAAELQFAASERRTDAERELKRAEAYDQLRSLLRSHRVKTVSELPSDAARRAVTAVAA